MGRPSMTLNVDLNDDGIFDSDWSAFLLACSYRLGRKSALDRFGSRSARFILDNEDGRFSPRNTSSPYSPDLRRGKRVQLAGQVITPAVANSIRNPSAEIDLVRWSVYLGPGTITRVGGGRYGGFAVQCQENGAEPNYGAKQLQGAAPATGNWTASAYVKGIGASIGKDIEIAVRATGGAGGEESTLVTGTLSGEWQRLTATVNVTAGDHTDTEITVRRKTSIVNGDSFLTDAWMLEEDKSSVGIYCDGDQHVSTWDGTAHNSASSRVVDPNQKVFTGTIRNIRPSRVAGKSRVEIEATGITEVLLRQVISAGPFARERADFITHRLLDISEGALAESIGLEGERITDGAFRLGGDAWVAMGSASFDDEFDTGAAGDDPVVYDALEGDNVLRVFNIDSVVDGVKIDVTSFTTATKKYQLGVFIRGGSGTAGKQVDITIFDDQGTPFEKKSVFLTAESWQYVSMPDVDWDDSSTLREIRFQAATNWTGEFWVDGFHLSEKKSAGLIDKKQLEPTFLGTKWSGNLEYIDAFDRKVGDVLDEVARSVGGWYYEDGNGDLIFEDYSQRDDAVVPVSRVRFDDEGGGGIPYKILAVEEPAENEAGKVTVGSFGDVTTLPAPADAQSKQVWALEPASRVFAANELQRYFADYISEGPVDDPEEGQAGAIARRAGVLAIPISGWAVDSGFGSIQTPYVINYGRSGEVVIKNDGSGETLLLLIVYGRVQSRATSERALLSSGSGIPILELEMPAQGYQTQAMTDLLTWVAGRYTNTAPLAVEIEFQAIDTELQLWSLENWIGVPARVVHDTGPGAIALLDTVLYYCESVNFRYEAGRFPVVRLGFEES